MTEHTVDIILYDGDGNEFVRSGVGTIGWFSGDVYILENPDDSPDEALEEGTYSSGGITFELSAGTYYVTHGRRDYDRRAEEIVVEDDDEFHLYFDELIIFTAVTESRGGERIPNADIESDYLPYPIATTDSSGEEYIALPEGNWELSLSHDEWTPVEKTISVDDGFDEEDEVTIRGRVPLHQEDPIPEIDDQIADQLQPTLVGPEGREVTPIYTETFRATTENDNKVHKTLCGESKVEAIGEDEWRITIEGLVITEQLEELIEMRPADNEIKVIGPVEGVTTYPDVSFDRFTYEHTDELNKGTFSFEGEEVLRQLFEFQLQTQDDDAP